jgi:Tol biopolymer transport system component
VITDTKEDSANPEEGFGKEKTPVVATAVTNPVNEVVLGATTGPGNSLYYYSQDDQAFKKATLEGKDKTVLMTNLPGKPLRIIWSGKRDAALVLIESSPTPRWYSATFPTKSLVALKPEVTKATWGSLGDKIYYLFKNPSTGELSLNRANSDGSDWKEITKVGTRDLFLGTIPQSSRVSFWTRPNGLEESFLDAIDADGNNRAKLFNDYYGGDYLWSPNGERVVVSASLTKGGPLTLAVMNKNGGELQSLNIPTIISKVTWSNDSSKLFYALPGGLGEALLPNDYFEKNLASQDTFWQIDLGTGKSSRLLELADIGQSFDSTDLSLSADERSLFFTDRVSKKIYRIDL